MTRNNIVIDSEVFECIKKLDENTQMTVVWALAQFSLIGKKPRDIDVVSETQFLALRSRVSLQRCTPIDIEENTSVEKHNKKDLEIAETRAEKKKSNEKNWEMIPAEIMTSNTGWEA